MIISYFTGATRFPYYISIGFYERLVGLMKRFLKKSLGKTLLSSSFI